MKGFEFNVFLRNKHSITQDVLVCKKAYVIGFLGKSMAGFFMYTS